MMNMKLASGLHHPLVWQSQALGKQSALAPPCAQQLASTDGIGMTPRHAYFAQGFNGWITYTVPQVVIQDLMRSG